MIDGGSGNIRIGSPLGMFGSDADLTAWQREAEAARRAMPAGRRFQVSPRMSVVTPSGVTIAAGSAVDPSQLHGGAKSAWAILEGWVRTGRVLEAD